MDTHSDERALLDRCFANEREAWESFVSRYGRLIYSVVYETLRRHGQSTADDRVDDLFNDVFLALYDRGFKKLRQWSGRCSLASWIRLIAASTTIDQLRRQRDECALDDSDRVKHALSDDSERQHQLVERIEGAQRVQMAMADLQPADRELLVMLFRDDLPAAEVATRLGIAAGALYTRKNRALGRLRVALAERFPEGV